MRGTLLVVALLAAACQPPPGTGVTVINNPANPVPVGSRVAPTPGGAAGIASGAGYQAQSRVDPRSAPVGVSRADMMQSMNPLAPSPTGETPNTPYDIGAAGQLPPQPTQAAPIFQNLRQ
jgi:hypothetical protein